MGRPILGLPKVQLLNFFLSYLILKNRELDVVRNDVELSISEEYSVDIGQVAEEIKWLLQMSHSDDFAADVVVQSVQGVGEDEAVADPDSGLDCFFDFAQDFEGIWVSVLKESSSRAEFLKTVPTSSGSSLCSALYFKT